MTTTESADDCRAVPDAVRTPPTPKLDASPILAATPPDKARRWSLAANAGAIASAFMASACCVGPLVFALLGLGGAGLLVKFEPYRPYFVALTFGLLGTGFYFTYRKPQGAATAVEGDACGCSAPRTNHAGRIMLWAATVLVVGFLAFPYIAPLIWD
ncbi:MAG TPA: mercuric transporter MerT family protein [Candidatus Krumholzibacteria bacterium]